MPDPHDLPAFLRAIQAAPEDDAPRLVLADWLDELGLPAPVGHPRFPGWARLGFLASVRRERAAWRARRARFQRAARSGLHCQWWPTWPGPRPFNRHVDWSGRGILHLVGHGFPDASEAGRGPPVVPPGSLDHIGTATVAGIRDVFVSEPYLPFARAFRAFDRLALFTGGVPAACREAAWSSDCCRLLLFPPSALWPGRDALRLASAPADGEEW